MIRSSPPRADPTCTIIVATRNRRRNRHARRHGAADDDKDYLASMVRTFAHDVDDIRLTLHQNTELGLAAARRVALLLQQQGRSPAEARQVVCAAAKTAWRQDRQFATVLAENLGLAEDGSPGLTREQIQAEVDAQRADSERLAAERHRELLQIPGFQHPVALSSLSDAQLGEFDAVFAPGGHGPMVDLADNPDVGRLLTALQARRAPIAALCTGVLEDQIRAGLAPLGCVDDFRVDWQWIPAWRPADITAGGRELRAIGFTI